MIFPAISINIIHQGIGFWRTDKHVFMDHINSLAGTLLGCALTQSQLVRTLDLRIEMTGLIK
jgi:hypothetical protein